MLNQITCPHCGKEVEVSEALKHEFEEKLIKELGEKHKKELEEVTRKAENKIENKLKNQFELQIKTAKEDLEETQKRNKELLEQLTELNKLIRDLKKKDDERTYETEKKIIEAEDKAREEAKKKAVEESHLKILEKEKQLSDALRVNEELKRKLQQGSMQTQGEVLELELEKILKNEFPNDKVLPVGKGIRGADLIQEVWDRNGNRCGTILWESKNAKWNNEWLGKLKNDQRQVKADIAVLISEILPSDIKSACFKEGIWLAHRTFTVGIGMALRANIIQAHHIRHSVQGKNMKMEVLYNYLSGIEFKQRVEGIIDSFTLLQEELEKEKRWFAAKWARQEKQIRNVVDNTHGMHGDLKGIMGVALPDVKSLESPE